MKCKMQETTINRKKQRGSVESGALESLEKEKEELADALQAHKKIAHGYCKSMKEKCPK